MNKKLFFFFWIILGINKLFSQTGWELLNPKPTVNTGKDIKFISNNIGYIITSNELLKTINAGATWSKKQNISSGNDMSFYNSLGYIVGDNGYVLKTENNGEVWNQISTGFDNENFNTVNIIDNNNIILSSSNNIIKTNNGGLTWDITNIINYPNGSIVKTTFLSSLVGHAASTNGKILKTIDGGLNWYITSSVNTASSSFLTIYFINENIGFATNKNDEMFKTTNSGETWIKISGTGKKIYDLYFLNDNMGFATGDLGATYKTNDGGNTWSPIFFQSGLVYNTSMYGIFFQNNNIGYATGARGRIIKTEDGGNTWINHSITYNDFRQLQIVNNNIGYVQTGDRFYKTTNFGNSWVPVGSLNLGTSVTSSDFTFVNENLGYATTYGGHIYKTVDGGMTWSILNNGNTIIYEGISSIFFLNENTGFISGGFNQKKVMKTSNGGNSWTQVSDQIFGDIQFVNQMVGYGNRTGNSNGAIYKTTDGGNTWNLSIELADQSTNSFHFTDVNNGYLIGQGHIAYKTNDGGTSWQQIEVPYGNYTIIKFYSPQIGYIVKDNGSLYKTLDGGSTWTLLTTQYRITSVELANNYVFTAGDNGIIYRSEAQILATNNKIIDEEILIYPNPATDFVNIKINNTKNISLIELFNLEGKLVYSTSTLNSHDDVKIDMSYYSKGMYFLKINLKNNKTIFKKIILK